MSPQCFVMPKSQKDTDRRRRIRIMHKHVHAHPADEGAAGYIYLVGKLNGDLIIFRWQKNPSVCVNPTPRRSEESSETCVRYEVVYKNYPVVDRGGNLLTGGQKTVALHRRTYKHHERPRPLFGWYVFVYVMTAQLPTCAS